MEQEYIVRWLNGVLDFYFPTNLRRDKSKYIRICYKMIAGIMNEIICISLCKDSVLWCKIVYY